ncbi:MAG: hypothetical protein GF311_20890 [Candidatus Lokiarchaeota archaeon]|nr:hypothetical protein [Candidatus Lokiarchaeota archaeon]
MDIHKNFERIKKSHDPEKINDFIINLSEYPKKATWEIIDYFLEDLEQEIFENIKINLTYLIGKISLVQNVPEKYLNFLIEIYYQSDKWVRNEIIKSFEIIIENQKPNKRIIDLLKISIKEDYIPIKKNTLGAISKIENVEFAIIKNILIEMDTRDSEILNRCKNILKNQIKNEKQLFEILNEENSYTLIKLRAFRNILTSFFKSLINIEPFRNRIEQSNWENSYKIKYLEEIDTFQKILLSNL